MNSVLYKEQPAPRKRQADRKLFEGATGFRWIVPQHLDPETPKNTISGGSPPIGVVRVWSLQGIARVVSGRVRRSPALRQRSWPNVDNQRTPRGYPQVPNPGGLCFA